MPICSRESGHARRGRTSIAGCLSLITDSLVKPGPTLNHSFKVFPTVGCHESKRSRRRPVGSGSGLGQRTISFLS